MVDRNVRLAARTIFLILVLLGDVLQYRCSINITAVIVQNCPCDRDTYLIKWRYLHYRITVWYFGSACSDISTNCFRAICRVQSYNTAARASSIITATVRRARNVWNWNREWAKFGDPQEYGTCDQIENLGKIWLFSHAIQYTNVKPASVSYTHLTLPTKA